MRGLLGFVTAAYFSTIALAHEARLAAFTEDGATIGIFLDDRGVPRLESEPESTPSILDFGPTRRFSDACYYGLEREVVTLVKSLVWAAQFDRAEEMAQILRFTYSRPEGFILVVRMKDRKPNVVVTHKIPTCVEEN